MFHDLHARFFILLRFDHENFTFRHAAAIFRLTPTVHGKWSELIA